MELEPLRALSLGILTCLAVPFEVTFTPRYAPLIAGLSLNGEPSAHAAVQSIREVSDAEAVSIRLEVPNAYAVLGGLLCLSGAGAA